MKTIKHLLEEKGREVYSVGPDTTVFDALKQMADENIGALMVVEDGQPIGLLSERDYARNVILKGKSSRDTPVHEIMSKRIVCSELSQTVEQAMALVTEKRVRHLPVLEGGALVGLVSIGDLVKAVIAEQQFVIEQLEQYING